MTASPIDFEENRGKLIYEGSFKRIKFMKSYSIFFYFLLVCGIIFLSSIIIYDIYKGTTNEITLFLIFCEVCIVISLKMIFWDAFCTRQFKIYEKGIIPPMLPNKQWAFKKDKEFIPFENIKEMKPVYSNYADKIVEVQLHLKTGEIFTIDISYIEDEGMKALLEAREKYFLKIKDEEKNAKDKRY